MVCILPYSGLVPLHNACSYGHYEVTELLLKVSRKIESSYCRFRCVKWDRNCLYCCKGTGFSVVTELMSFMSFQKPSYLSVIQFIWVPPATDFFVEIVVSFI